ncbi:hypothetical protein [Endozoicomonas sp. 8E]|uniref:hypothetical protein n=1 Tax=Endozoicomonas sp. 8E TaxID=3035692 RepID=UPI0029390AC6|nr:hypothetical protein [Endozoicomonas sp. 8E]WOG25704.1 hypothetical protein P6910_14075 [Endozoicomonas sp. 8E]
MNVQTGHASGFQNEPRYSAPEIHFLGLYAGFKANNFHLKLGNHYHVIHDLGTPEKLSLFFKNQWLSHLPWFLLAKLLPPSTVPYPSFSRGFPSLSRAFGDAPDCNPHPVMIDHSLLKGRLSVQTACIENHPVWQITASPPTSSSETQAVKGDSLSAWLSLWKLLNDTNTSTLFLRPWREDQLNRLQAILCQTNPLTEQKKCQSVLIDFPLNHAKPWLLPELAKKDIISADGQTALDSHSIKRVNQAIDCLSSHDKLFGEPNKSKPADKAKIHACQNNHWLYQWSDQSWLYQSGIPETVIKPSPALMTGKYFNLWALEKVSPGNDTYPAWSRSSLFIARNDRHRKYHFWGAGDPVLVMGFADAPYNVEDHYAGRDGPIIGTLVESEHLNLATLLMNTVTSTPFNFYQWRGIVSGFTSPIPKSLSARVREQIVSDPGSLYQFVKRQPELLNNVLTYLNREFPGHPLNSYFSGRVSPFFSHQTNGNPLALVPKKSNAFDGFHPPAIPHQRDMSLPSTGFASGIMTASGVQGNNGPPASQSRPSYPSAQKAEQSSNKSKRTASPDGRDNVDDNEPPPPPGGNHPVTPADTVYSESLLKHLLHLYRSSGLRPDKVNHRSDFLPEQLGITSSEKFETLIRQCQPSGCESETLYNQMLRGFDPKNQQHMALASKALQNSIQVIVHDGQEYSCYKHDKNHDHTPRRPLERLEDRHVFLFYKSHAVKLSSHSDNKLWFTHFLTDSRLNTEENDWLAANWVEKAIWDLFPQWQKDVLLCRESLENQSIKFASETLKQAFTSPGEFTQGGQENKLFRFYNKLGLVCYPFDDAENPDGMFYISKNVLGAVIFFWEESASKYIFFIAPDLSTSAINDKIQSLDNHLKDYSEGAFLVKKQDIRYVIPALIVLAPVFRKTYTEAEKIISDTEDALVYGGLARWQHLRSSVKATEVGKVPVTNDIDLAVKDTTSLENISASIEEKLRAVLPGTTVRRNNIYSTVVDSPKILQRRGLLDTLKINCFPDKNEENTIGFASSEAKKWRILSIDISAGPEGYFDFIHVEPFAKDSKLAMPNLPAMVEKLLQDTQLDQTCPSIDSKRRMKNAQNVLKILLSSDTKQQVQTIIQKSAFSSSSESSRLPEFLHPYIKPKPDNEQKSIIKVENKAENDANNQHPLVAAKTKTTTPAVVEPLKDNVPEQKTIAATAEFASTTNVKGTESITHDPALNSRKKKKKQRQKLKKTVQPKASNIATTPDEDDIKVEASPDDQRASIVHNSKVTAPDTAEHSNKRKKETTAQKPISNLIDFETALSRSIEISNWLKEMDYNFSGELNRAIKTRHCGTAEESKAAEAREASDENKAKAENPAPNTELDTLQNQLKEGKAKTLKILACSGASADTSGYQPFITINLTNTLSGEQRIELKQAAYEDHFPYAQLVQALFILNKKLPSGKSEALQIYENAFELLLPAAIAGVPLAYQLLIGMQLHNHHPVGWPQIEPVNRLLRSMTSRETSFNRVKIEGLLNGGFLEQLYQDTDVTALSKIEQGLTKESDLSGRGREVKAILNALREPNTPSTLIALKAVRPGTRELQQTIASLKLILERKREPAAGQIHSELWTHSLNTLQIQGASKKKSQFIDITSFPQVLAMTDLKVFMGTERTGQSFRSNQPKFIAFWKMSFWEEYLKASLSKDRKNEREVFEEYHDKISNKATDKFRPYLINDWVLARSFLLSRSFIQIKEVPVSTSTTPPATSKQVTSGTGKISEKTKKTTNSAKQSKGLKPGIRISKELFDEHVHIQYLLQLDNNIIQEVRFIQENPEKFLQQVEKQISAFRRSLLKNKNPTNELGIGYYYFLKALALMRAKVSDDNRTIELSFSPEVKLNAKNIKETIIHSQQFYFPYARMLMLFFDYAMEGEPDAKLQACVSAFSGLSQSIEILLEMESDSAALAGMLLKWLLLIPKPFELRLTLDADIYLKNPPSKIPGRITPSIRILREFLDQLPLKSTDDAVDLAVNRISEMFLNIQHLPKEQHEQVLAVAAWLTATEAAQMESVAMKAHKEAQKRADAVKMNEAAVAFVVAKAAAKEASNAIAEMEMRMEIEVGGGATAAEAEAEAAEAQSELSTAAVLRLEEASEKAVEAAKAMEEEAKAEAILRLVLHFATDRIDLLQFNSLDISSVIMRLTVPGIIYATSSGSAFLTKKQLQLAEDINPEKRAIADIIKLAFHLLSSSEEVKPVFPHLEALPLSTQVNLTANHFGHDLQLLTKLISLFPELAAEDKSQWYNIYLLIHEYTIKQFGGNAEQIKQLQNDSEDWKKIRKWLENHIWYKPLQTGGSHLTPKNIDFAVFDTALMKEFKKGDERAFIFAIEQSRRVGYPKLSQRINQYKDKNDPESVDILSWLHCLAGLTLLEAEISSDHQRVILNDRKRVLSSAYDHFFKARKIGFQYAGYLESLVLMRLINHYQYYQDETSEASQTDSIIKPVIEYASTKKPEEKIFIEAGKIVTEILPGLLSSSIFGVRFAAETAIRIFTDKRFNLLHIPQAGWPAMLIKHLLVTPVNHSLQFLFNNDDSETEKALFPIISDPDSIEGILLKPLEETRQVTINERLKDYSIFLDNEIENSSRPENIKKYLSLVKAFVLDKPEVLDTASETTASDSNQLSENIASYELSRYDYTKLFEVLQETPHPETGFDEFVYNLPQLESHPNYEAISNALLKKHRTKSALVHYYLWAYETLNDNCDNERDLFWDGIMTQKIEKNEPMKRAFFALLATADLTVMYEDKREAMITAFKQYNIDLASWLAFLHSIKATSALFLGEKQKSDFHFKRFSIQKEILPQAGIIN